MYGGAKFDFNTFLNDIRNIIGTTIQSGFYFNNVQRLQYSIPSAIVRLLHAPEQKCIQCTFNVFLPSSIDGVLGSPMKMQLIHDVDAGQPTAAQWEFLSIRYVYLH